MSTELNHSSHKIEEALGGLDGMQRAKAPAFFYTRLKARLERELEYGSNPVIRILTRPALALSIAIIVLVLNTTVIMQLWKHESTPAVTENSPVIASEYSMGTYPVYDENASEQ